MYKYLMNLLNKPNKIEKGQVWINSRTGYAFVITDDLIKDRGIVRASIITKAGNVGDKNDVVLDPKDYKDIFPKPRTVIRATDGPIKTSELNMYMGCLTRKDLNKVVDSLKNKNFEFLPVQSKLIATMNDKLSSLREESVKYFEETSKPANVFNLPAGPFNIKTNNHYSYPRAAADSSTSKMLREFWKLEKENKKDSVLLDKNDLFALRLTFINKIPYLIFVSFSNVQFRNVKLITSDKNEILLEEQISLNEDKRFIPMGNLSIPAGLALLQIEINKKILEYNINFE